jgi:methylaspartate ammonia-lyase
MKIERAIAVPVLGGYFNDDLAAIRAGARRDGFFYEGRPVTPGFTRINQPSEAVSIVLLLTNGQAVAGDAMSVEYSGAGGRLGRFRHETQLGPLTALCRRLQGRQVDGLLAFCDELEKELVDDRLHKPAALYAISQAVLQGLAAEIGCTCAEVLGKELGTEVSKSVIPINVQSGEQRRDNVDKAIAKQADALPHGLINEIETTLGSQGELLKEYVSWIARRIQKYGSENYRPEIHIDVYGLIGQIFEQNVDRMAGYVAGLGERAQPHDFCLETPVLMDSCGAQMELIGELRNSLRKLGSPVKLIVDEWANTIEDIQAFIKAGVTDMINVKTPDLGAVGNAARAVLECWAGGVRPILGGSCTDTDQSARVICHVALATRPAWVLARPGMGVDEGMQIVRNEMIRTLAIIQARNMRAQHLGGVGA